MRFRKLRIAWSVAWGILAVLLVVLWLWSYWHTETVERISLKRIIKLSSAMGYFCLSYDGNPRWGIWGGGTQWEFTEDRPTKPNYGNFIRGSEIEVQVPFWLIAICTAAVIGIPWIPWSKRFSLRSLLFATTLVAVVLGLILWLRR
jgi:hypothetical protein